MGRKSLAPVRREQILDALEVCIGRYGLGGSSLERIAEEAGVQRTIIRHYFGSKDAVVEAVIARLVARYQREFHEALAAIPPDERLAGALDYLFGDGFIIGDASGSHERDNRVLNELFAWADHDARTRELLLETYHVFEETCRSELAAAFPDAQPARWNAIAYSLMCLAFSNATFLSLGFDPERSRAARAGATTLLAGLAGESPTTPQEYGA